MAHFTGGCLCGSVRYAVDAEPIRQLLCHCIDCQRHTGTAFLSAMVFPADSIEITGSLTIYTMPGGQSGEPMHRRFCSRCGTPITINWDNTGKILMMAGTLDDRTLFKPQIGLFCDSAPPWVVMPKDTENLPRYLT
jgi:hypothetical protein